MRKLFRCMYLPIFNLPFKLKNFHVSPPCALEEQNNKRNTDANELSTMGSNEKKESSLPKQSPSKSSSIDAKLSVEPESHLQSLGLTMNNGKARFKLDEDAPLYSNSALSNFYAADGDDTLSFVVLSKDSLDCIQQSSVATYVDIQEKCMCIDYNSMIASLDSTEVHQKLTELLQENTKLKETLKQNNLAMKQQFNTLAIWQEEIMKVHQNHKKKFAQTRELINYLKKENVELKMRLSSEVTSHTELDYEVVNPHNDQVNTKEEKMLTSISDISNFVLRDLPTMFTDNAEKNAVKQAAVPETIEKVLDLERQAVEKKQLLEEEKIQLNKEKENLEVEKRLLDEQKKNLEAEYKSLNGTKELLQQERMILQDEKTSLDQQSQLYETHYSNKLETERQKFEAKCDLLSTELGVLHDCIERKETAIQEVQKELGQYKENIDLLETQLKMYEEDFEQERELKEKLLKEKCTLNVDLQKQIEFNEELQQEINRLCNSSQGTENNLVPPRVSSYSCPKCDFTFRNMKSLEDHIRWCIEE